MKLSKTLSTLSILCLGMNIHASEIDSFTLRYQPLEDSSQIINKKANDYLKKAVVAANQTSTSCSEKVLMEEIRKDFNILLNDGKLSKDIVSSEDIPKHTIERKDSIFKYHKVTDGYLLARPAADMDGIGMGTTLNFNGHYIGSDKFEHMFGQGYHYFKRFHRKGFSLKRVLLIGNANERLHLGGNRIATGVYTFGDLVANFQGMRFWNHLLQTRDDIFKENIGPYIDCVDEKWELVKEVDFRYYVDAGFDEAINCSAIISKNGFEGVTKSIEELEAADPQNNYTCPLDPAALEDMKRKYDLPLGGMSKKSVKDFIFNPWDKLTRYKSWWWL